MPAPTIGGLEWDKAADIAYKVLGMLMCTYDPNCDRSSLISARTMVVTSLNKDFWAEAGESGSAD